MPVKKMFYPGGSPSPIQRKPFIGDPAQLVVKHNPEPSSVRGKRRTSKSEEYERNLKERQSQKAPAGKTRRYHKGPHKRPSGMSNKDFAQKMINKFEWDC